MWLDTTKGGLSLLAILQVETMTAGEGSTPPCIVIKPLTS